MDMFHTEPAVEGVDYLYDDTPDFENEVETVLEYLRVQDERQLELNLTSS